MSLSKLKSQATKDWSFPDYEARRVAAVALTRPLTITGR